MSPYANTVDYHIHGVLRIRLVNPTNADVKAIDLQLKQFRQSFNSDPDITIRFTKELPTRSLTYLGLDCAGFTDEGFYIFSSRHNAKFRIPFEQIGGQFEIFCQSGLRSLPWLFEIINLTFLVKGYVPLHASAFVYDGVGVVVTGWTKGGKTEALLAFANHGAHYVGDEWVILSRDGDVMFGLPVPICVWEWYFDDIPKLLPRIGLQRKTLFKNIHFLDGIHRTLEKGSVRNTFPIKTLGQALPVLKRQLNIRVLPEALFGSRICKTSVPDKLILSLSHNQPTICIESCNPTQIAERMVSSNALELAAFLEYYQAFKFAFPHLRNEFLENIDDLQYSLFESAFAGKDGYKVSHPYPVPLEDYFSQLSPLCKKISKDVLNEALV
jgi:hypothetical protein